MKQTFRKIRLALQQLSYRQVWNRLAFEKPMDAVLTGADSEIAFDAKGKADAEWLISIIGNDKRVLDVGCGMGRIEKFLAPHCRELHAIDVSPVMIGLAQSRLKEHHNVTFKAQDATDLSNYEDAFFDAIFSLLVLQHMDQEDAFRCLLEFNRLLKMNGNCIIQFPELASDFYFKSFLQGVRLSLEKRSLARTRCYTEEEVRFKMQKAGFSIQRLQKQAGEMVVVASKVESAPALKELQDLSFN
jgi:ubiquinone/menaquinone biosynthesis C-methylase UbiE